MLSTTEIIELEKKVLKYRLKQKVHYLIIGTSLLFIGMSGFYFYSMLSSPELPKTKEITNTSILESTSVDNNFSINAPNIVLETNTSTAYSPKEKIDDTLFLKLPILVQEKVSYSPAAIENKKSSDIQEEELSNKISMRKLPTNDDENFYRNKEDLIDTALLPPPQLNEPEQKGMIKIETHEINSIQYLKEKFDKTHNIIFALMLAEEYYLAKNYNESNKWALIANNVDSENEKSWIWFAKSKIKLGHKEDAILALKAYLKNNKSNAAESLLNQINVGEVLE